jgi:hypothetical protein
MKRITLLMIVVAVFSVWSPALGADVPTEDQKNECLLASKGCLNQVDTLQQKIRKLNAEIQKGTRVYTPAELKRLNDKLKEAEYMVDELLQGGGG